jgi:ribosomal protein S18 acetylase RimI-like enzyme
MKISFEALKSKDLGIIIEFMHQLYDHENISFNEKETHDLLETLLNNVTYGKAFLILADNSPAGYMIITFGYSIEYKGRNALIDELFIADDFRRKGIGTKALRFAEKFCKKSEIKVIHLEVNKINYAAVSVYRKAGFKENQRSLMTKWI